MLRSQLMSDERSNGDLIKFIAATVESMRDQMATKDDLVKIRDEMEVMRGQMATKDDLRSEIARLETKVDLGFTTVHGDFEQVHLRFDTLDRALSSRMGHIETEVSRLRSVVYLLVRDKPDMLRLLGQ